MFTHEKGGLHFEFRKFYSAEDDIWGVVDVRIDNNLEDVNIQIMSTNHKYPRPNILL